MAAQTPSSKVTPGLQTITNTDLINIGTGGVSGLDFMYVYAVNNGQYEIVNQTLNAGVSGPVTNPNFPTYTQSRVNLTMETMVDCAAVNVSGTAASGYPLRWNKTHDNIQGGFNISGNIYTASAGEFYIPLTKTAVAGTYTLPTGQLITLPQTVSTGMQQYYIMQMPGPWPAGLTANTSATIPSHMATVHAEQASILQGQLNIGISFATLFSNKED